MAGAKAGTSLSGVSGPSTLTNLNSLISAAPAGVAQGVLAGVTPW